MLLFSTVDLMDEQKCYAFLIGILHPNGLCCRTCKTPAGDVGVHRRDRAPVLFYHCPCGCIYNAFSGTVWQGTHHACALIVRILQGFVQGVPTLHLAKELGLDRKHLLERRHQLQGFLLNHAQREALPDGVVECDEMYQNAGEKRNASSRSGRPAAAACQQGQGARHVGQRPSAGGWNDRTRERRSPSGSPARQCQS